MKTRFLLSLLAFLAPAAPLLAQDILKPTDSNAEDQEAFKTALRDSQRGDAQAMGTLGLMYEKGLGCATDLGKAFYWINRGARKGDAASENNLGYLYLKGLGVKEDDTEALIWFQKAADQGLASAQGNLGLVYGRGLGVRKDYDQALLWFKKAAEQGDSDSQVNLAQMLSLGEGAPKDYVESHKWFSIALQNHALTDAQVEDLRNDIGWLENRMTGAQIDEARKRASGWEGVKATPTPGDP
jgi:uncharacterized protein